MSFVLITFLSRLPVIKYLLSGVQSQDQMIRLWTAVFLSVYAQQLKIGPGIKHNKENACFNYF